MKVSLALVLATTLAAVSGCSSGWGDKSDAALAAPPEPCTPAWNQWVEHQLPTGDGAGHGPDLGSEEWQSVVEFRLGVRGQSQVPQRRTPAWCDFVHRRIQE
nr:hypothetical protein [Oceanococcus sp. HetDA_MAG_MS8]